MTKTAFLYPYARYHGEFTPTAFLFNANLQEFAYQVGITCSLQTGGKLSPTEAFQQIEALWHQLQVAKEQLEVGDRR
ncbi:MAG: hypothetical protein K6T90_06275 [Leptolyngbyaceae cyanobacterium HOT.MB2.61]|nr:hypothetical protein [Leptolyngbyaceae cyanobacterium HOT.MB2.61]